MKLSSLILAFSLFASATADGYNCAGGRLINPTEDSIYIWPEGWKEGQEPAKYAGNQICNWQINVLPGYYAKVTFFKNTDMESGINCQYPNGVQAYIEDKDENPYIFTYPQFQVNLQVSDKQGEFSFKVEWVKYPGACQMNMNVDEMRPIAGYATECVTTVIAPNKAMLVGFTLADDMDVLLRQTAIYDGDSVNGEYLGYLYYARYNQVVASSQKLTIYTFGINQDFNYTLFMVQDVKAAGDVEVYTGMNCPSDPTKNCALYLNSEVNVTAIATISRVPDFLSQLPSFPPKATLKIYEGQISDDTLLATINRDNFQNQLPIEVKNSVKIYHLDTGRVVIPLSHKPDQAQYKTVFDGRTLKIQSFDYRRNSYDQDTIETFSTSNNEQLYFKFNVNSFGINGNTTLGISVSKAKQVVYSDTFSSSNMPPNHIFKILGDQMTVNYQTYGNYTLGFEVALTTTKNDVSPIPTSSILSTVTSSGDVTTSIPTVAHITSPSKTTPIPSGEVTTSVPTVAHKSSTPKISSTPSSDSPVTTTIGTAPRATTLKYESTTKSGISNHVSLMILGFVLFF